MNATATKSARKPGRREATPEQKAAAAERKANIRAMFSKISALPIEKRVILAAQYGLRTAGKGHELSPSNTLLVMMQFPSASVVGGFEQWRKAGRVVKKGVKAIGIWVPIRGREAADGEKEDTFFMIGNVFDISQTADALTGADYDGAGWTAPAVEEIAAGPVTEAARLIEWTPEEPLALPAPVAVVEYEAPEAVAVEVVAPERETLKPLAEPLESGEVRAVSVERLEGKHYKNYSGSYAVRVRYTWQDGTTSEAEVTSRKAGGLAAAIERDARDVAAGCVTARGGMIIKRFSLC